LLCFAWLTAFKRLANTGKQEELNDLRSRIKALQRTGTNQRRQSEVTDALKQSERRHFRYQSGPAQLEANQRKLSQTLKQLSCKDTQTTEAEIADQQKYLAELVRNITPRRQ
jgi:hypothetical protein